MIFVVASMGTDRIAPGIPHIQNTTAATFPIGRATVRNLDQRTSLDQLTSNPPKQHKNDNDNQDDADNADTTMSIAVTVTAEAAAEARQAKI
jgi:hypothetical protein